MQAMSVMKGWASVLAAVVVASGCASAQALEPIEVTQGESERGSKEVRVVVPGRMKIVIADGAKEPGAPEDSGITGFYDLVNDPEMKYNYAATWSGFFSHKIGIDPRREGQTGAIMPAAGPVEVIEANAVRAVVKCSWPARAYGGANNPANPDVRFEQIFTVCAPDRLVQTLALIGTGEEVKLKHCQFMLHTSHAKFAGGTSNKGGVYSIPAPWTFIPQPGDGPKTAVLHAADPGVVKHGDGTESRHKENFLMVIYGPTHGYGYRANLWVGYRTCINLGYDKPIRKGDRVEWNAVTIANHDVTSLEKAEPYIREYREPGAPKCAKGEIVGDGFDEGKACYTLKAAADGVEFTLPVHTHWPIFEIAEWKADAPKTITVAGEEKKAGKDFIACIEKGTLLLQIASDVDAGTQVQIGR